MVNSICDCCDERPAIRKVFLYGIETLICAECAGDDDDDDFDPYEAAGESRFGLPGGGRSL